MKFIDERGRTLLSVPDSVVDLDLELHGKTCANLAEGLLGLRHLKRISCRLSGDPRLATTELRALASASHVPELWVATNTQNQDITPLAACTHLDLLGLDLYDADAAPLAALVQLKALRIDGSMKNIQALGALTSLRCLSLAFNNQVTLKPLADLTKLEKASFLSSKFLDIEEIRAFQRLHDLDIRNTNVASLSVLEDNGSLDLLHLDGCRKLARLDGLERLTSLSHLTITELRAIPTLRPLAALHTLKVLHMQGTRVADGNLLPLMGLSSLEEAVLTNDYGKHALAVAAAMPWCQFSFVAADRGGQLFEVHGEIEILRDLEDEPRVFRVDQDLVPIFDVDTNDEAEGLVCDDMERTHPTLVGYLEFDSDEEAFIVRSKSLEAIRAVAQRINEIVRMTKDPHRMIRTA